MHNDDYFEYVMHMEQNGLVVKVLAYIFQWKPRHAFGNDLNELEITFVFENMNNIWHRY